jgi:hypothetical protein
MKQAKLSINWEDVRTLSNCAGASASTTITWRDGSTQRFTGPLADRMFDELQRSWASWREGSLPAPITFSTDQQL